MENTYLDYLNMVDSLQNYRILDYEIWYQIPDYPKYELSSYQRVRKYESKKLHRIYLGPQGYKYVFVHGKRVYIHRLVVLLTYGPLPKGKLTRHLNSIKMDNRPCNLEYGTYQQNTIDSVLNGDRSKLTKEAIEDICNRINNSEDFTDIAKIHNVSRANILNISLGQTWAHVTNRTRKDHVGYVRDITDNEVREIKIKCKMGYTQKDLARMYDLPLNVVYRMVNNKAWKHLAITAPVSNVSS